MTGLYSQVFGVEAPAFTAKKEPCLEVIKMLAQGLGVSLRRLFWDL